MDHCAQSSACLSYRVLADDGGCTLVRARDDGDDAHLSDRVRKYLCGRGCLRADGLCCS